MVTAGIVAEYNPFHNGHRYQLEQTRRLGATHIAVFMSGNYVQRGEPAIIDKWTRALFALKNGADLVIELPVPYVLSSAESYALGAIKIMNALGCIDMLSFGSEVGDILQLQHAADAILSPQTNALLKEYVSAGKPFARAREDAVRELYGDSVADVLKTPNNILATEYIKALRMTEADIRPIAIKRLGAGHDCTDGDSPFVSATYLRGLISSEHINDLQGKTPESVYKTLLKKAADGKAPCNPARLETAILAALRRLSPDDLAAAPDIGEGLENRLYQAIRESTSLKEIMEKTKSKRYTLARIRRIIWNVFLQIPADFHKLPPPYIRVLGLNNAGREILRAAKQTAALPIILKAKDALRLDPTQKAFYELEAQSTDLYNLALPKVQKCAAEMTTEIVLA